MTFNDPTVPCCNRDVADCDCTFAMKYTVAVKRREARENTIRVFVCSDCLFGIEYDEWPDNPEVKRSAMDALEPNQFYVAGDSKNMIAFSKSPCGACGSGCAGSRYEMFILEN